MTGKQRSSKRRERQRTRKKARRARRRQQLHALGKLCLSCKQEIGTTLGCRVCQVAKRLTAPRPRRERIDIAAISSVLRDCYAAVTLRNLAQNETLLYSVLSHGQGQTVNVRRAGPDGDRPQVTVTRTPDADDTPRGRVSREG